jgi:hypothetical protein
LLGEKGEVEEVARHTEITAGVPVRSRGGEGREKEGEADRWGRPVSGSKKRKKEGREVGCCGRGSWAGGPAGLKR